MARIIPDGWRELAVTGAARREIETLTLLADGLPEGLTVYHGVHWTSLEQGCSVFGDIDFAVVGPGGDVLLIEQKSGFLEETPEGLVKRYPQGLQRVHAPMARTVAALEAKLAPRPPGPIDYLLYCPDYTVREPHAAGIAPERIIDASRRGELVSAIRSLLQERPGNADAARVHRFFSDTLRLEPDVSALVGRAEALVTRVSAGLATWARQLEFSPFRLRVVGTAGSGKTQLALAEYRAALERGERPLYVCYNRPLADHFGAIVPAGGVACTFHTLCQQRLRAAGQVPDFSRPDAFAELERQAAALLVAEEWLFDAVIIDEGQDFAPEWKDALLRHARPDARMLWLEDPLQNLYGRPAVALPGWVSLRAESNFRSPRPIVRMLQALLPEGSRIEPESPFAFAGVELLTYRDGESLAGAVKEAIRLCLRAGFRSRDIAYVSYHGRDRSRILPLPRLGPHSLKTFTGRYDLFGQPGYSEGEILAETVYRFKGQAAPAVIFGEIDFEEWDEKALRKLFVGATRAMMKLVLVAAEGPAQRLREVL